MTRIVLARHGESAWHREDRYVGVSDIGLTERGHAQARELGAWAPRQGFAALISSPLRRCRDTAAEVVGSTGLELRIDDRLTELDFGIAEGRRRQELKEEHPEAYRAFVEDPVAHHFAQGEDPIAAAVRFVAALTDLIEIYPQQRVLVVAHATVLRLALCRLLGLPLSSYRTVLPRLTNGSISEIELTHQATGLLCLNVPLGVDGDSA